jgi:hypothetical protein
LKLELHAYQTYVFLDWRDLRADATHPWGELCDALAGRGVTSLEDALTALRLKPVHAALRAVVDPALAQGLANCVAINEQTQVLSGASSLLGTIDQRILGLLTEVKLVTLNGGGELHASSPAHEAKAQGMLRARIEAALKLAAGRTGLNWTAESCEVLPLCDASGRQRIEVWASVLGWCALEAIGSAYNPLEPEAAAEQLFDTLRLREPLAEAFAFCGLRDDEPWRAAARLRASFAHSSRPVSPGSWIHDPDVAWLIGVHQHEGVSYVVKEHFEHLIWWMALRDLLDAASGPQLDHDRLVTITDEINRLLRAVQEDGYRVDAPVMVGDYLLGRSPK